MSNTEKNIEYHPNGIKKEEGTYKDGKKDGLWTYWYENGRKRSEGTFKDGELKATKVGATTKSNILAWIKENI